MPKTPEFTLISGDEAKVNADMMKLTPNGWRPILMSTAGTGSLIIITVMMQKG